MSDAREVKSEQTMQIVTDRRGRIVGAMLQPAEEGEVSLRMVPLKGQSWYEVRVPREAGALREAADFQRLAAQFHVPRGRKELARKTRKSVGKRKRAPGKRRSA
jgi:hypothetical protein